MYVRCAAGWAGDRATLPAELNGSSQADVRVGEVADCLLECFGPVLGCHAQEYGRRNRVCQLYYYQQERSWVRHAAKLRGISLQEYVKRAINAALVKQGVDAILFGENNHV